MTVDSSAAAPVESLGATGDPQQKQCCRCHEYKTATKEFFHSDRSRPDGLMTCCKMCKKSYLQSWKQRNPERNNQLRSDGWHRRRAVTHGCEAERVDRMAVWGRDEGHCRRCSAFVLFEEFHLDHIIPISLGGAHAYYNVQTLCGPCNIAKGVLVE